MKEVIIARMLEGDDMIGNNLVSIIVPIYNVEKYIEKCVKSLIEQDYKNIEILLINDGSTDNSKYIIEELGKKDRRITVINKENKGVSSARNDGLKIAQGEYVMFVDGDDWVDRDYVSYYLSIVSNTKCIIGMGMNHYDQNNKKGNEKYYSLSAKKTIELIYLEKIFVAVWNKIYSTNFLKEHEIYFRDDIWYGEGMLFNIECLQYIDRVAIGKKLVYHQTFNPNSAMRNFNLESNYCGIRSLELQKMMWKKKTLGIENAWKYNKYRFNISIIDGLIRTNMINDNSENKEIYKNCLCEMRRRFYIPLVARCRLKNKVSCILYCLFPKAMIRRHTHKYIQAVKNEN